MRLDDLQLNDGDAYWIEGRPAERGRCVIVREHDGVTADLIAEPYSARTRGSRVRRRGDAPTLGTVYFSNATDRRLYTVVPGQRRNR